MRFARERGKTRVEDAPLAVVIAAEHPATRVALDGLLSREPDLRVVANAASVEEAQEVIAAVGPDVLVLDWRMRELRGVQALRALRAAHPDLPIISLSPDDPRIYETPALAAGATAYVSTDHPEQIVERIRETSGLRV